MHTGCGKDKPVSVVNIYADTAAIQVSSFHFCAQRKDEEVKLLQVLALFNLVGTLNDFYRIVSV